MADGSLGSAYEALERGDEAPLRALLAPDFEWAEPDGSVRRGGDEALRALMAPGAVEVDEVVEAGERAIVTGILRGQGAELPFAHVWELSGGAAVRAAAYFDRGRLTGAAARRQLADVADDLLEQAAEIRRQWDRLGDALRAAGLEDDEAGAGGAAEPGGVGGASSARLLAVDLAHEGSTREEIEAVLREELAVEEPQPILDEVFGSGAEPGDPGGHVDTSASTRRTRPGWRGSLPGIAASRRGEAR